MRRSKKREELESLLNTRNAICDSYRWTVYNSKGKFVGLGYREPYENEFLTPIDTLKGAIEFVKSEIEEEEV